MPITLYHRTRDILRLLFTNTVTRKLVILNLAVLLTAIPWRMAATDNGSATLFTAILTGSAWGLITTLAMACHQQRADEQGLAVETIYRLETHTIDQ